MLFYEKKDIIRDGVGGGLKKNLIQCNDRYLFDAKTRLVE